MGFSVTAAHVIFLVAILGVGSYATTAYWSSQDELDDARRTQARLLTERAHTNMSIESTSYDGVGQSYTVDILNHGSTTLRVSELHYLVDGAIATATSTAVEGNATTDLWLPGETLAVVLGSISTTPTYFHITTGNGATLSHTE